MKINVQCQERRGEGRRRGGEGEEGEKKRWRRGGEREGKGYTFEITVRISMVITYS